MRLNLLPVLAAALLFACVNAASSQTIDEEDQLGEIINHPKNVNKLLDVVDEDLEEKWEQSVDGAALADEDLEETLEESDEDSPFADKDPEDTDEVVEETDGDLGNIDEDAEKNDGDLGNIDGVVEKTDEVVEENDELVYNTDGDLVNTDEVVEKTDGDLENTDEVVETTDEVVENTDEVVENTDGDVEESGEGTSVADGGLGDMWENDASNDTTHDDCVATWEDLSQNTGEAGCVEPDVIDQFARKCRIPELKDQMIELKSKCGEGKPKQFMAVITETQDTPKVGLVQEANSTLKSRRKRFVMSSPRSIWTGGKVPFIDGTSQSNIRAMKTFERFTCIRFYPWSDEGGETTNDKLGLNHQSYLKFVYEGGCWADQGNTRRTSGQKVSCCGGITCVHEIGHALGAYHEHQNPLGKGTIRLNPQNAESDKVFNFKETVKKDTYSAGFDMASIMAYGKSTFSNGKGEVISYAFSDVGGGNDWYYLLMEISNSHKCDELYCSDFTMECVNDGYLTLVDDVCGCMCPPGLDPSTGCSTQLSDTASAPAASGPSDADQYGDISADDVQAAMDIFGVDISALYAESSEPSIKWPAGQFALPQTTDGCPSDSFSAGSRIETGAPAGECKDKNKRGCKYWLRAYGCDANPGFMHEMCPATCKICDTFGNHQSATYHLAGTTSNQQVEHSFCVKEDTGSDDASVHWPAGQYCLYRMAGTCPDGFDSGSATFTDEAHSGSSNSESGSVPDGQFTSDGTTFEFCCTKYGFIEDDLVLPRTKPFALLKSSDENRCHHVRGMHVYDGYVAVKNSGGKPTISGDTPVRVLDSKKNTYSIGYCYYTPTEKEVCGGVIDLTGDNPTATITGTSGQEFMCNWMIKGPESTRILLKFDEMNLATEADGRCIDKVTLHYNRLAQPGIPYCGDRLEKSISTVNNTLMITYDTFRVGDSSFTATASLISQENLCYNVADKGHSYAGTVARTRGLKTCIPWVQASHCPHSPFKDGDMMDGLQDNYCRNPDTVDGLRPWCYTQAEGCQRDYCDVCLFENLYDIQSHSNCEILAENGVCDNDPNVQEVCAGLCKDSIPSLPTPTLVKGVSCSAPEAVVDGDIVGSTKSSYDVGDVVTYTCKDVSSPSAKERKCLSTGEWSSLHVVCTECELGWVHRNGHCYKLFKDFVTNGAAVSACADMGASLAMAKTEADMDFLSQIDFWYGSWLAASDAEKEDTWIWSDGTPVTWTRWMSGQPDNYYEEDCVWMTRDGKMEDRWCTSDTYTYICMKAENAVTSCDDVTDDCINFYSNDATSCSTHSDFMHRNCKKTCGMCSPVSCSVEDPAQNAQKSADTDVDTIDQGAYVTYECKPGFRVLSGDTVRGCLVDGSMSGEALQCQPDNEVATSDVVMEKAGSWGSKMGVGYAYSGNIPGFVIPKDGKIVKWQFWSTAVGKAVFQVWRPTADENKLEFVGQNMASTPKEMSSILYVPEAAQISVQQGDFLGIYYTESSGAIGYSKCDTTSNLKILSNKDTSNAFAVGQTYDFKTETKEACRTYRFKAIVA